MFEMAKLGVDEIWHKFLNSVAKYGPLLLCQILRFQILPNPNPPPQVHVHPLRRESSTCG